MERKLYDAARYGREEEVRKILKENKDIEVNLKDEHDTPSLSLRQWQ
jgi:hypothetical protein